MTNLMGKIAGLMNKVNSTALRGKSAKKSQRMATAASIDTETQGGNYQD